MKTNTTTSRSFCCLNLTQAIGSFQDNLFKMMTVFYLSGPLGLPLGRTLEVSTLLLVAPFLLFSNLAGALADRFSKSGLIRIVKWAELVLLGLAFPAYTSGKSWPMLTVLGLLASQSAFFCPLKRGIIPECVAEEEIGKANARMTSASYVGIIAGMVLPSVLLTVVGIGYAEVLAVSLGISVVGLVASYGIERTAAKGRPMQVSVRVVSDTVRAFRAMGERKGLRAAAFGCVAFTGLAAFFQQALVVYATERMDLTVEAAGFPFLFVAAGIAAGAWLSGRYSAKGLETGSIPAGILLTTLGFAGLVLSDWSVAQAVLLLMVGFGGGLCLVPMAAYLQTGSDEAHRGEVLGASETASFAAIVVSAGVLHVLSDGLGMSSLGLMAAGALLGAVYSVWAFRVLPTEAFRFGLTRLVRALYKVNVEGEENIPKAGGALFAMNHTSFCDAPIAQSVLMRRLRFVMSREVFTGWTWCRPAFRANGAIQIHTTDSARELIRAIGRVREALKAGEFLGICPEGELTKTGRIEEFKPGVERMLKGTDVPVIPVYIGNMWGSMFSFARGEPGLKWPSHLFRRRIVVRIGKPMPTESSAAEIRAAVGRLGGV